MINIKTFTSDFLTALTETFHDRVWFVGLQGSYSRGEATESSDIDMVVILDELTPSDIRTYNAMLDTIPNVKRELLCGFLSGKAELLNWDAADMFQFYHDTQPLMGSLDELLTVIDDAAVDRAIKLGACNIYHGCVHNMLYGKKETSLVGLYKAASFVVQAIVFRQTGKYVRSQKDLLTAANPDERAITETFIALKNGGEVDFDAMSDRLYNWAKKIIVEQKV